MTEDAMTEFARQLFRRPAAEALEPPEPSNRAPADGDDMRTFVRDLFRHND